LQSERRSINWHEERREQYGDEAPIGLESNSQPKDTGLHDQKVMPYVPITKLSTVTGTVEHQEKG
jgi:hypothetical protein